MHTRMLLNSRQHLCIRRNRSKLNLNAQSSSLYLSSLPMDSRGRRLRQASRQALQTAR